MTMAIDLFSNLNQANKTQIWNAKAAMLQQASITVQNGTLVAQKGWYSSAHELWKFLVLPYRDVTEAANALENTAKAYTWYSSLNEIKGMFSEASCIQSNLAEPQYFINNAGIDQLSYV
jgi:hypothetical protein